MENGLINKDVLEKVIAESGLCQHAKRELELAGYNPRDDDPNGWMYNQVMEAVAVFASHGNSGASAPWEIDFVKKLCNWETISPLTFKDDEWQQISSDGEMQNRRKGSIFKDADGSIYDIYAYRCMPVRTLRYGAAEWEKKDRKIYWSGEVFETKNGLVGKDKGNKKDDLVLTGRRFSRCLMKGGAPYVPKDTVTVPVDEIEVSPDNWVFTCSRWDFSLAKLADLYEIRWEYTIELDGVKQSELGKHLNLL